MAWLAVAAPEPGVASRLRAAGWHARSRAGAAARILSQLALDPVGNVEPAVASADDYTRLVVYDLVGALFAPPTPLCSRHTDKLFARVCGIIKNRFADPNISPSEAAAEMGISLRYLQSLFTDRGSTCSHYISSLSLDHAVHLIERRASMKTGQPLAEIAYACGFAITRILRADSADVSAPRRRSRSTPRHERSHLGDRVSVAARRAKAMRDSTDD
jgi:AraC family transcriptional activator of tynA and feaB